MWEMKRLKKKHLGQLGILVSLSFSLLPPLPPQFLTSSPLPPLEGQPSLSILAQCSLRLENMPSSPFSMVPSQDPGHRETKLEFVDLPLPLMPQESLPLTGLYLTICPGHKQLPTKLVVWVLRSKTPTLSPAPLPSLPSPTVSPALQTCPLDFPTSTMLLF